MLERKKLAEAPMTMPRATRTAARREMANSKVMTRKSLSELNASATGTGRSSATPTTPTSERRTGSKSRNKTTNEVNSPAKHNGTTAPRPSRRSNKAPDESETTVQVRTSLSPVRAVSTRRWVASTSASTGQQSDSPSGSKRTRGQRSVTTSTQQQTDSTTKTPTASRKVASGGGTESSGGGTSTSSPIRTKRAAIVLTPLSAVIRRTRVSNGAANSGSPSVGTSPRRPNRKATRKEVG